MNLRILTSLVLLAAASQAANYRSLPLSFEPNHGQAAPTVHFITRGQGYSIALTSSAAAIRLAQGPEFRMRWLGASPAPQLSPEARQPGHSNYLTGSDPARWLTAVPNYTRVRYTAVYPGIDLVFYGNQRQLEYDFLVAPGADPSSIALDFQGAQTTRLTTNGDLLLHAATGDLTLLKPVAYQTIAGARRPVQAAYRLRAGRVSFDLGAYDPAHPLTIDPVLAYSTYLGAGGMDGASAIATDTTGNVYVAGWTSSSNFPTAGTPVQSTNAGFSDAFLVKIDPSGTSRLYATYLGGTLDDHANAVAVDSTGNIYLTGSTSSANFPILNPVHSFSGGSDAFVTKLNSLGVMVYSTYLGGSSSDEGRAIAADSLGNAYVAGITSSSNFPTMAGAFRAANSGFADAFVTKINPAGSAKLYSTYLGGASLDEANGLAVDTNGNAWITGSTWSANFPVVGALQSFGGSVDAFVTKINPAATAALFSTYLGGSSIDRGMAVAVDPSGNAYIAGNTGSSNLPTTVGAYQKNQTSPTMDEDAFVARVPAAGGAWSYLTYLSGTSDDSAYAIAADAAGNAYVTGQTASANFPLAQNLNTFAGAVDAFITVVNPTGATLVFSTPLGGAGVDSGRGIALSASGLIHVAGLTNSTNFPVQPATGALQPNSAGGIEEGFVAAVTLTPPICCKISGHITLNGAPFEGVTVNLTGSQTASAKTDAGGAYSFANLTAGGSFTVTPTRAGYTFTPTSRAIPNIAANQIANFTATAIATTYQISGLITHNGVGLKGVTVNLTDSQTASTTTNDSGAYSFANLTAGGSFTVTPTKACAIFSPPSTAIPNIAANQTANFTATAITCHISGQITLTGAPLEGVTVSLTGSQTASTKTDSKGDYILANLIAGGSFTVTPTRAGYTFNPPSTAIPNIAANQIANFTAFTGPIPVSLNPTTLAFGAKPVGPSLTPPQDITVTMSGGSSNWTAASDSPWLGVTNGTGVGNGKFAVAIVPSALPPPGAYTGKITVNVPGATNGPLSLTCTLTVKNVTTVPFGSFDTPADFATGISGSIAVTGWALDDIGVKQVTIWRDRVGPEAVQSNGYVYIGDAMFVAGARPDVERSFPSTPLAYRAGWGYMMLTYGLPAQGNGTYRIHALATDVEGNQVRLGTKTITVDNAHSTKPFGAIDTPAPGETVSGTVTVSGWALTPPPCGIATDGSTISVYVNGADRGHPIYSQSRPDVASIFPGYINRNFAGGSYPLVSAQYPNGLSTLAWVVTDNCGHVDGMGSRYFNILNATTAASADPAPPIDQTLQLRTARLRRPAAPATSYPAFRHGYDWTATLTPIRHAGDALLEPIELKELDRLELYLPAGPQWSAALRFNDELRDLPIGSTFDPEGAIFYWQLGPGFLGEFALEFRTEDGTVLSIPVRVGDTSDRSVIGKE